MDEIYSKESQRWLNILKQIFPNSTKRSFNAMIGVSPIVLSIMYDRYISKCYSRIELLLFYNWIRTYIVEDFGHCIWRLSKQKYRDTLTIMRELLVKMDVIKFSRIRDIDHPFVITPKYNNFGGNLYLFVGVIDTFEAYLEKNSSDSYWLRHKFISVKKGNKATFKYQVVVAPLTGDIISFSRPFFGRQHDSSICKDSKILDELQYEQEMSENNLFLLGDLAYKGEDKILTKHCAGSERSENRNLLNKHRNTVERIIGYIRRFKVLNEYFRHNKHIHHDLTHIVVQTCQLEIQTRGIFKLPAYEYEE